MKVIVGNNLEKLVRCLADRLAEPPAEKPLAAQTVVVQSAGMAKWILLKLAEFHGIAANYRFPFPRKFLEEVFAAFIPGYAPDPYFDASVMTWALWEMLPGLVREEEFGDVARYLGEKDDPAKR
jgi:exodeoxyribonuclease V gamma subunit